MKLTNSFIRFAVCAVLSAAILYPSAGFAKKKKRAPEVKVATEPMFVKISSEVVNALKSGDLNSASKLLHSHPASAKSMYLLRQINRILVYENTEDKPKGLTAQQRYKDLAISYHNLFLFVKSQDGMQNDFFKKALDYYKKSNGSAMSKQKLETGILTAALYAANGETEKASKLFEKYNQEKFAPDFQMYVSLASYYAATGNVEETINSLRAAHKENPEIIMSWVAIGDDFYLIREDISFKELLNEWQISKSDLDRRFSYPKTPPPKLKYSNPPIGYKASAR